MNIPDPTRRRTYWMLSSLFAVLASIAIFRSPSVACLNCDELANTLSENIRDSTVTVIAVAVDPKRVAANDDLQPTKFRITKVLKGELAEESEIEALTLADESLDGSFLLFGFGPSTEVQWSAPLALDSVAREYLLKMESAPRQGPDRLAYFLPYLIASDKYVADDAYNEFARAKFEQIVALDKRLDRQWVLTQLHRLLADPEAPPHRVRLMWTLLAACGTGEDAKLFLSLANDPKTDHSTIGFNAALSCYMALAGKDSLPFIEQRCLASDDEQWVQAGLNAVRFHAVETKTFSPQELAHCLHPLLDKPQWVDFVIPDLARLQDWTVGPQLVQLFRNQDKPRMRLLIVNYIRSCPMPEATQWLDECRQIDSVIVTRSETMFRHLGKPQDDAAKSD